MRILVVGASRGIGLAAVREALRRGHRVRALARSADGIVGHIGPTDPRPGPHPGPLLEPVAADAADAAALAGALGGVDAVIYAIGMGSALGRAVGRVTLFSETTRVLVAEMRRANDGAGVRRLVAVTGFGAGDSRGRLSLPERVGYRLLLGAAYDDKDRQEVIIRGSGLDWLIVRPTILTNGARTGRYKVLVEPASWRNGLISRADVADFLVSEAAEPRLSQATPVLAY